MQQRFFVPWLMGLLLTCAIGIGFWRSPSVETGYSSSNPDVLAQSSDPSAPGFLDIESLSVESEHLLQDIEALAFERASESGRSRARRYLTRQLEAAGWAVEAQIVIPSATFLEPQGGVNLVAVRLIDQELRSSEPENSELNNPELNNPELDNPELDNPETYNPAELAPELATELIVAAHYDTVADSLGADDNGSGVATLLALARIFGDRPTPHPLKLVLFDHEEKGLWGSQAFVGSLVNDRHPVMGAVVLEMLGYACDVSGCQTYPDVLPITPPSDVGNFLAVVGNAEHPELTQAFQPQVVQSNHSSEPFSLLPLQVPALSPGSPDLLRSDHVPFWQNGYGAVMLTDTANFRNPHYHQPSDRPETLNPDFLSYAATTVARAIARLLTTPHSPS
ncbi:MAG: M28 family peptidase [Elainellaceae cyanobacterium]